MFRSSEAEANRAVSWEMYHKTNRDFMGPSMGMGGGGRRPGPYDRSGGLSYGRGYGPGGPNGRSRCSIRLGHDVHRGRAGDRHDF